ncbi:MAG: G5 domain-containing protein [Caldisericia bacterium]|nr:G5 domain-containing protein [Caldisericia bacterium]
MIMKIYFGVFFKSILLISLSFLLISNAGFSQEEEYQIIHSANSSDFSFKNETISVKYKINKIIHEVKSPPCTVEEFFIAQNIEPEFNYELNLQLNYLLRDSDFIDVVKVDFKEYTTTETSPYNVIHKEIDTMENGLIAVWIPGENGLTSVTYLERYENDVLTSKSIVKQKSINPVVDEIIGHGTCVFNGKYLKKLRVMASSYNPTVAQCDGDPFTAASGKRVCFGMVAVDTKVIKLGTKLYVEGYGYAFAGDTGGLIKGNRIDCFLWRKLKNDNWRGGYINIYILE